MGRSILYVPGLSDMSDVGTFAAITIFQRVARKAADVGCGLEAPCADPSAPAVLGGS